ncbi:MAG: alkaline phosphatase PhoX, partial [Sphingomonadales bacterium]
MTTRRGFLIGAAATTLGFSALYYYSGGFGGRRAPSIKISGYGPLQPDSGQVIDLPEGFSYTIVSQAGDAMIDGLLTPGRQDAMAAFPHSEDQVILVLNHELGDWDSSRPYSPFGPNDEIFPESMETKVYDAGIPGRRTIGGTSTILYNLKEKRLEHQFLSLGGTQVNCAGGQTPWGSWLTCEENFDGPRDELQERHGYVFEVPASANPGLAEAIPLKDMGRFVHEAACVDPETGIVYLTQDAGEALFYRFIPNEPGNLKAGGTLQALVITKRPSAVT